MSTAGLTKVSMNLTERDIRNTEDVRNLFHVRTNVDAVSAALGITRSLGEMGHSSWSLQKFPRSIGRIINPQGIS